MGEIITSLLCRSRDNAACRQRQLLWLRGEANWSRACALALLCRDTSSSHLWVGELEDLPTGMITVPIGQGRRYLGGEFQHALLDAHQGLDPDDLGAVAGTLLPGGFLILLSPPVEEWLDQGNPVLERLLSHGENAKDCPQYYLRRLVQRLQDDSDILVVDQNRTFRLPAPAYSHSSTSGLVVAPFATIDQQRAVAAIEHVLTGHRRRPLVMTSDRGRGKTLALAIAVQGWLSRDVSRILVTAPSRRVTEPMFLWLQRALPALERHGNSLRLGSCKLEFVAPDELLLKRPSTDILLVDEAAAIPVPLLECMVERYSRLVFSSTVHGYEGTGRGFAIRFQQSLDRLAPGWSSIHLCEPVRYAENDPLEATVNRLLLLNAEPAEADAVDGVAYTFHWLDQSELAVNEALLCQVFGLLIQAHYQTSPLDLMHLLDCPSLRVACLKREGCVVAVMLLVLEGGLGDELIQAVYRGKRRPHGHLVPQTLAAHAGVDGAAGLKGYRVMRIAVADRLRRKGLGIRLLEQATRLAEAEGLNFVASSFGASSELLDFWHLAGFQPVHLGSSRNAATGEHAVVVLKGIGRVGEEFQSRSVALFYRLLFPQLSDLLARLDFSVLWKILTVRVEQPGGADKAILDIVEAFAFHHRPYTASSAALRLWLEHRCWANMPETDGISLLVRKVLQGRDWRSLAMEAGMAGQKPVEEKIREAIRLLWSLEVNGQPRHRAYPLPDV